jgi:glycosyltransferase involved in cell wall biosynthesis
VLVAGPAADRADSGDLERAAVAPLAGIDAPVVNLAGVGDAEVARLMAGAAAFCLPSLMEGFGMAVAEAMACGAPVVVSDRGALPEVVGDAGLVTEPGAAAVEAALHRVLTDAELAADLRRRSVARAAAFSWDATARGVLASLERAVSGRGR